MAIFVFVGGEAALEPNGDVVCPNDVVQQTRLVMDNIGKVLSGLGAVPALAYPGLMIEIEVVAVAP